VFVFHMGGWLPSIPDILQDYGTRECRHTEHMHTDEEPHSQVSHSPLSVQPPSTFSGLLSMSLCLSLDALRVSASKSFKLLTA